MIITTCLRWWLLTMMTILALILASCGGATPAPAEPAEEEAAEAPAEPAEEEVAEAEAEPAQEEAAAEEEAEPAGAEKTTITYWFNPPEGGTGASCFVETLVNPFNETNPNIFVEAVAQPNAWDATRTALAGGGGPDVVVTPGPS